MAATLRVKRNHAFTILEVSIAIVIIAILTVLMIPVISKFRARAQRAQCSANLKNLYIAADLYLQENGTWPQIARSGPDAAPEEFANAWITALAPFGPTRKTWICPTIENLMENPDYTTAAETRIDYIATPFDDKPATPHRWPRQPWFAERADVHGNGNLIIFTDGSIGDLKSILQNSRSNR